MNDRKKSRLKRSLTIFTISLLSVAVVAFAAAGAAERRRADTYKIWLDASYQHAFNELVTSVNQIDSALQKSVYATSPSMTGAICTEVFGKAMTAQMSLGTLPCTTTELEQTAGFISRIGDYAFSLSRSSSGGEGYTEEELSNLKQLSEMASLLAQNLTQMQADMENGYLTMDELYKAESMLDQSVGGQEGAEQSNMASGSMRLIESEFPEAPSLIYDGPFSEHISGMKPLLIEGAEELDEREARKVAADFLGMGEGKVYLSGQCEGDIPSYCFGVNSDKGELTLEVSRAGGQPISLLSSRSPETSSIGADEARNAAARFLERRGYHNMAESYFMTADNIMTINYAYKQGDVICYTDLIKVSVAMDTGAIVGFEAKGYIMGHHDRELPEPAVDAAAARERVSGELVVLSEGTVLIPTDGKHEVLCHEFKCEADDGRHYIIYVNCETGEQQKILILLEDENGTLTI